MMSLNKAQQVEAYHIAASIGAILLTGFSVDRKVHLDEVTMGAMLISVPFVFATVLLVARFGFEFTWRSDAFFFLHKIFTFAVVGWIMREQWVHLGTGITLLQTVPDTHYVPFLSEFTEVIVTGLGGVLATIAMWIPCAIAERFYLGPGEAEPSTTPIWPDTTTTHYGQSMTEQIRHLKLHLDQAVAREDYVAATTYRNALHKLGVNLDQ